MCEISSIVAIVNGIKLAKEIHQMNNLIIHRGPNAKKCFNNEKNNYRNKIMQKRVVHLTSAHPRLDTRIFVKICSSLAKAGYDVSLVVADGKGYEEKNKVKIFDVGKASGRLSRMLKSSALVYKKALKLNADIYHIHDPELLPYALLLKLKGKRVIFDSHEDVPRQILSKPYLNKVLLKFISYSSEIIETFICKQLDYIITATPFIRDIFLKSTNNCIDINNFPIIGELDNNKYPKKNQVCYVGGLTKIRGCYEMIKSIGIVRNKEKLVLAGLFDEDIDLNVLKKEKGWSSTESKGFQDRTGVKTIMNESFAGLVTLYPTLNYKDALPIKMFEYMSVGLPVISSNIPLWSEIINSNNCGICVDPLKPEEIAKAIDYLYEHPSEAKQMGENGRKAVNEKYNWSIEEKKLLMVYEKLLKDN